MYIYAITAFRQKLRKKGNKILFTVSQCLYIWLGDNDDFLTELIRYFAEKWASNCEKIINSSYSMVIQHPLSLSEVQF